MDPTSRPPVPGKVQAIGIMHLIGGVLNLFAAAMWAIAGLLSGLATFGIGLIYCCPAFLLLPVGLVELWSGYRHLQRDHHGLQPPKGVAFAEIASILGCSTFSMVFGILTLVFLQDPEVEAYYARRQLDGT